LPILDGDLLDETPDELLPLLRCSLLKKPIQLPKALSDHLGMNPHLLLGKSWLARAREELLELVLKPLDFSLQRRQAFNSE